MSGTQNKQIVVIWLKFTLVCVKKIINGINYYYLEYDLQLFVFLTNFVNIFILDAYLKTFKFWI